jgi:energy-coupling factor transport system substrate-specific component
MSWPIASFALLGLALVAGFAWYEREHPSARVLALVATLAALAALGRIAFEPIPNVKPTTDVVLIGGWALGGPAGFAVGAVAALASNVVFGQGPWTPFQMLGWGLCGLMGAALGRATGHRPASRWALAAACAAAAMVYGVVVDFGTAVTGGGQDVLPRFGAMYLGSSLPWNLAHAGGNVVFALVFGPALQRALLRYRARFTVTWRPAAAAPLAVAAALGLLALAAPLALAVRPSTYLRNAQNADGGWGEAAGKPSSTLFTGWATLGLAATGINPADQSHGGASALSALAAQAPRLHAAGDLERTILIVHAAGLSPRSFAGRDLVAALLAKRHRSGKFSGGVTLTAFGILALRAAGYTSYSPAVRRSAAWIVSRQARDGGWNFAGVRSGSTPDDTGAVLQALAVTGRRHSRAVRRGVAWLRRHQRRDGGFAAFGSSNAQSTSYAVQGLVASGRNPARLHRHGARSPLAYLRAMTTASGSVRYSRTSGQTPVWVTAQATLALRHRVFPLAPQPRAPRVRPGPRPASISGAGGSAGGAASGGGSPSAGATGAGGDGGGGAATAPHRTGTAASPKPPAASGAGPVIGSDGVGTAARMAGILSALALAPFPTGNR